MIGLPVVLYHVGTFRSTALIAVGLMCGMSGCMCSCISLVHAGVCN